MNGKLVVIGSAPILSVNRPAYRHLHRAGWDTTIVVPIDCQRFGREAPQPEAVEGVKIRQVDFEGPSVRKWTFPGIETMLEEIRPDIVHLDGEPDSQAAIQLGLWCRRSGARFTVMSCENIRYSLLGSVLRGDFKRALRDAVLNSYLSRSCDLIERVFVLSEDSVEVMRRMGLADRVTKMPLGFDETIFHPSEERRAEWRGKLGVSGVTVGYFGRMIREKGVHLLLSALAQLRDLDFTFLMDEFQAGTDYQRQIKKQLAESGLADRTKMIHVSHDEIPGCLNAVDIVVAPSLETRAWKEQYGRVVPEAMISGCAVVAANTGAMPELLGGTGVVFDMGDAESLADALRDLIVNSDRRTALSGLAVMRARELLSSRAQADIMEHIFHTAPLKRRKEKLNSNF